MRIHQSTTNNRPACNQPGRWFKTSNPNLVTCLACLKQHDTLHVTHQTYSWLDNQGIHTTVIKNAQDAKETTQHH